MIKMSKDSLKLIGVWLVVDGAVSFIYFQDTATPLAQLIRIIRALIGVYILCK
jgi:hypothetical protein